MTRIISFPFYVFSMNDRDFSVKSKPIHNFIVLNNENTTLFGTTFFSSILLIRGLKVLPKRFKCNMLVWNYGDGVNVPLSNCWLTLCWRNAFSARDVRLSLTTVFFCADFLRFIALNGSFSTVFSPDRPIIPPRHVEQKQIDAKLLEKVCFPTWETKSR